jgi:hypothetical protein
MSHRQHHERRRINRRLMLRRVLIVVCFVLALFAFVFSALILFMQAQARAAEKVDVELVFLADASYSIDDGELTFQRRGYADALTHPDVLAAIERGGLQRIAVTFIEWADELSQDVVVPWMAIRDAASAQRFAAKLMAAPRNAYGSNAIGAALDKARREIEGNAYEGVRKVIDLSADSANNWNGISIEDARARALAAGMTINGLAVLCREENCGGRPVDYNLEKAFAGTIIGGPGSFVVTADEPKSFAAAVRRKLILELASLR